MGAFLKNMRKYSKIKAFTLVEMLIVMAIIVILVGVGVMGGRFMLDRAIQIKNADMLSNLSNSLMQYYGDNGSVFPSAELPRDMISQGGVLDEYIEQFEFGGDVTLYYFVTEDRSNALFCVTSGGFIDSDRASTILCDGNGFGANYDGVVIGRRNIKIEEAGEWPATWDYASNWSASEKDWVD